MQIVKWYVGIGKDKDGRTILRDTAVESIRQAGIRLAKYRGGFTVYRADGGWLDSHGRLITEPVAVFEIVTDNPLTVDQQEAIRSYLIGLFDQSDVLVVAIGETAEEKLADGWPTHEWWPTRES